MLGSLAGSALFPTQLPNGPRITDNRTTTSTVGEPIPILFGTADLAGTVIWLDKVVEHSSNQGSKGGPEQKVFNYTQSIAIALCERVDDDDDDATGAISGISRIWENGSLVYDIRPQFAADTLTGQAAESDIAYANRLTVSAIYAETFTLYLGDEVQLADPTIEAVEGFGNAPPFRGLAYIVYPNRALQTSQGLRHPNFTFECYQTGIGDCTTTPQVSNEVLYSWTGTATGDPTDPRNLNKYQITVFNDLLPQFLHPPIPWAGVDWDDLGTPVAMLEAWYGANLFLQGYGVYGGAGSGLIHETGATSVSGAMGVSPDPKSVLLQYSHDQNIGTFLTNAQRFAGFLFIKDSHIWAEIGSAQAELIWVSGPVKTSTPPWPYPPWIAPYNTGGNGPDLPGNFSHTQWFQMSYSAAISVTRSPNVPPDPCFGLTLDLQLPGYAIRPSDGKLVKCGAWVKDTSQNYKVLQKYAGPLTLSYSDVTAYPLNPCVPASSPDYTDQPFWDAAYAAAVTAGEVGSGFTYSSTGMGGAGTYPQKQSFGYTIDLVLCTGGGQGATVASIIKAICKRAGLTQVDVSELVEQGAEVPGYSISSVCDAADIIAPLRSIAFFDCVESGDVMKFPIRGKEIVATFSDDDFGCFDDQGGGSTVPPSISVTRADETTLPRSIRLHYKSVARDYQNGEADSPFRLTTLAVDDQDVSLPLCLDDDQAARAADVLWSDAWAAGNSYELSVDQSWSELEGGDCIAVPIDGVYQRLRIVSDSTASGILRKLNCVRDDEGSYISYAVASAPGYLPPVLKFVSASEYVLMDLPCLRDADSDPGFYVAAHRLDGAGSWPGMTLYRSTDGGHTFASYLALTTEAIIGRLQFGLPESQFYTWDDYTTIEVILAEGVSLESITDAAVLAGGNTAAIGVDTRWEIVQFANATQVDATHWQLSRILRGRRGTEHNIGHSAGNDFFVMLSSPNGVLGRVVLQVSEIGALQNYRGVSIGASYSSGVDQAFTGRGEALLPFWPSHLRAKFDTAGDIRISWLRRSRIGRTLMSGVDIPLGETIEKFEVDILDPASPSSPEIVLRTLIATNQEFVLYTAAMQSTDFGSGPLGSIKVAIYQDSSVVGRGTPRIDTLTIEAL